MTDDVHITAGHRSYHCLGIGVFIVRCKNRLMEARNNEVQGGKHRT